MTPSEQEVRAIVGRELSAAARVGHAALVVAALTVVVAVGALLADEPTLPARTQVAFAAIIAVGIAWILIGLRVIWRRRPVFAAQRVTIARLVVLLSALLVAGVATAWSFGERGPVVLASGGAAIAVLAGGCVALARASRGIRRLTARRRELETARTVARPRADARERGDEHGSRT